MGADRGRAAGPGRLGGPGPLDEQRPPAPSPRGSFWPSWPWPWHSTALPLAHALGDRWATPLGRRGNLQRAARQGAIAGLLAAVLMGLRLLRVLNIWVALALIMAAVVVEALLRLRFR